MPKFGLTEPLEQTFIFVSMCVKYLCSDAPQRQPHLKVWLGVRMWGPIVTDSWT